MKYKITDITMGWRGRTLHRIQATVDFADVKAGDYGGWIQKPSNLHQLCDCWVYGNAKVYDNAEVYGNAKVLGNSEVFGNAKVYGDSEVYGNAEVYGDAKVRGNAVICSSQDYIVFKNWWSSFRFFTWTRSNNMWKVGCFYGTGEKLIEKAYKDSEESGREYERVVRYVESILKDEEQKEQKL